jgi:hypothetical protein
MIKANKFFQKTIVQKSLHIRKACHLSFHLKKIVALVLTLPKPKGFSRKLSEMAQFSGFPPKMTK